MRNLASAACVSALLLNGACRPAQTVDAGEPPVASDPMQCDLAGYSASPGLTAAMAGTRWC